jgi:hypothetical protein
MAWDDRASDVADWWFCESVTAPNYGAHWATGQRLVHDPGDFHGPSQKRLRVIIYLSRCACNARSDVYYGTTSKSRLPNPLLGNRSDEPWVNYD